MRKYFLKLAAFALALCIPFVLFLGVVPYVPDKLVGSLPDTLHYKIDLLHDTPGRRIIFTGGSAAPYGIDCAAVAAAADRPAICIGVTAYLGLGIYLNLLDTYAREGDTVVLMLENLLLRDVGTDYLVLWEAVATDREAWAALPPTLWPGMVATAWRYCREKMPEGWNPLRDGVYRTGYDYAPGEETWHHKDFGPLGDVTAQRTTLLEHGWNTEDPVFLDESVLSRKNLFLLQRFIGKMQERGVTVLFAHAPLDELCLTSTADQNAAYAAAAEQALGVPVLVPLTEAILPAEYFYDSNNHLTSAGAALYTERLLPRLLEHLPA